jgi:hypothetical protein
MDMASTFARTHALRPLAVTAALLGSLLLAGCTPAPAASSSPTTGPTESGPAASGAPTPSPAETAVASEPVEIACEALITPADMYAFNPNISMVAEATPKAGSKASEIAAMGGQFCQWANNSSNTTIDVAVARLGDAALTDLKNRAVTESKQVPTYAAPPVEGYFTMVENEGEAQVFTGPYWITIRAIDFFEPGDAEQLAEAAIAHLS